MKMYTAQELIPRTIEAFDEFNELANEFNYAIADFDGVALQSLQIFADPKAAPDIKSKMKTTLAEAKDKANKLMDSLIKMEMTATLEFDL